MRVLVFGPTSYIASAFVEECLRRRWDVFVVARDRVRWRILGGGRGANVIWLENGEKNRTSVDVAINFAYAKKAGWHEHHNCTRELIKRFISIARNLSARAVVQVSTQAVFGYTFQSPPRPVPVPLPLGDAYIEGKVIAERLVLDCAGGGAYIPAIVRLGNVIGPGVVPWTATLATHILLGRPIGAGKSNATYIGNVVDYLCYVAMSTDVLKQFGPFHHLAEFSMISWKEIVDPMCEVMGVTPWYTAERRGGRSRAALANRLIGCARYLAGISPLQLSLWLGELAETLRASAASLRSFYTDSAEIFAQVMCEPYEFMSHVLPAWRPPIGFDSALDAVRSWLTQAGYADRCANS
jgi:nucleoside-diphosphate-sugar epimerase